MAVTEPYGASASIGVTEYSLPASSTSLSTITDDGIYELYLDLSAMIAGDEYFLQMYEKVISSGTKRVFYSCTFAGTQGPPHKVFPSLILLHGWDITLTRIAGADRTIAWSIRKVI